MLLLAVLMLMTSEEEVFKPQFSKKRSFRIQNDLEGNVSSLLVHCKSVKDNVSEHELVAGACSEWEFKEKLFWRTTYRCNIKWNKMADDINAYSTARDESRCKPQCWWSIRSDGGYSFNEKRQEYEKEKQNHKCDLESKKKRTI
ncbi:hypothetical protein NL676_014291 [Syzygium grande]|nr:hypothetical protein NL676_014291 [Syzygium grande]